MPDNSSTPTVSPVVKRTPREWNEKCGACSGRGIVHRRQHFALLTPDEFDGPDDHRPALFDLDPKHDAPADAYVCRALGGASIFDACNEGREIARMVGRPVAFEFNGALAVVRADADPTAVAKEWWKRAYGKTYEQSMRDR